MTLGAEGGCGGGENVSSVIVGDRDFALDFGTFKGGRYTVRVSLLRVERGLVHRRRRRGGTSPL